MQKTLLLQLQEATTNASNVSMWNFLDGYFDTENVYQHLDKSPNSGFALYATIIMVISALASLAFLIVKQVSEISTPSISDSDSEDDNNNEEEDNIEPTLADIQNNEKDNIENNNEDSEEIQAFLTGFKERDEDTDNSNNNSNDCNGRSNNPEPVIFSNDIPSHAKSPSPVSYRYFSN